MPKNDGATINCSSKIQVYFENQKMFKFQAVFPYSVINSYNFLVFPLLNSVIFLIFFTLLKDDKYICTYLIDK